MVGPSKTERERIADIVAERNLASYMNDTKWEEFRVAMLEEMPIEPPHEYKTLFEDDYTPDSFVQYLIDHEGPLGPGDFDEESFNGLDYKAIEWVKVRPRFFTREGPLLVRKDIWHDYEKEFVAVLEKHSIPYEEENGVYTIYGYKPCR